MTALYVVLALVATQRLGELSLAARNTRFLLARGGREIDHAGYLPIVALHAGWLLSLALFADSAAPPSWPLLAAYAVLQLARAWVIASLGRRWTTRIVILPGAPPIRNGPYRWLHHPNYLIVAAEIALLPAAFGALGIAVVFSLVNAALLIRRAGIEDRALRPDRTGTPARLARVPSARGGR